MDRPYTVEGGRTPGSKNDRPDLRKAVSRDTTASGERVGAYNYMAVGTVNYRQR
jgi:hypothetical protein